MLNRLANNKAENTLLVIYTLNKQNMGHINEPPGVTFTVINKRLTKADKKELAAHIQQIRKQKEQKNKTTNLPDTCCLCDTSNGYPHNLL